MQLDSFTILVSISAAFVVLGLSLLYFWNRDRRSSWLLWWSVPFVLGGAAVVGYARPNWDADFLAIGFSNAARLLTFVMFWQGARVFEGRRPLWWAMVAIPLAWLGLSLLPSFVESMAARIVVISGAVAALCALGAWELWRGRAERLSSRIPAAAVLLSFGFVMLVRMAGVSVMPFPMGALPLDPLWMAGFNLVVFVHGAFLGLLLIALSKERLELEQRNIALVDPLTSMMNRRAFMGEVERHQLRRGLPPEPLALLVLDLDDFKAVNDRHGHDVGDRVLASFASVAAANVRATDLLYRLGGEEFCFVLPNTDVHTALRVAERVRKAFAAHAYPVGQGRTIAATVSIGIATTEEAGFDLEVLLAAADAALYEAKSRGRNRVVLADPDLLHRPAAEVMLETQRYRAAS